MTAGIAWPIDDGRRCPVRQLQVSNGVSGGRKTHLLTLSGLLRRPISVLWERFGAPDIDRRVGRERWLIYRSGEVSLRIRCTEPDPLGPTAGDEPRVASWTARFVTGHPSLRDAAVALDLWPVCAPDEIPGPEDRILRRPLRDSAMKAMYSLTATIRDGRVVQMTAFDEAPEWLDASSGTERGERA